MIIAATDRVQPLLTTEELPMTTHPKDRPAEVARLLEAARTARSRWIAARLARSWSALGRALSHRPAMPAAATGR